jgi:hypothetical protein
MRGRHEGVTAIACASQDQHAEEMARHLAQQPSRVARRAPVPRARVAARSTPVSEPEPAPAVHGVGGAEN